MITKGVTRLWDGVSLLRAPRTYRMLADDYLALEGPVERRGDRLVLRVPMNAGGERLRLVARATSYVEDDRLVVVLPEWLAGRMQLEEGSTVHVDDRWGRLNISRLN